MSSKEKITIDWKNVARLALVLLIITVVAALCLALTNYITAPTIAQSNEQSNTEARQAVLPEAESFEAVEDVQSVAAMAAQGSEALVSEIYIGKKGDETVGYTVKTTPTGYGGTIEILTGITKDGVISGITILSQDETPGLGAKATEPAFQEQFKGKAADKDLSVVKGGEAGDNQIQAITGATITSTAVVDGVNLSEKIFKAMQEVQ
ncbi:MAG: RnfABCDGE type electron transport complex subunit G [Eubacterium sp.]|nr:RnfABCDGE type electron transport complex subunit G [Eubacterium sp.]